MTSVGLILKNLSPSLIYNIDTNNGRRMHYEFLAEFLGRYAFSYKMVQQLVVIVQNRAEAIENFIGCLCTEKIKFNNKEDLNYG